MSLYLKIPWNFYLPVFEHFSVYLGGTKTEGVSYDVVGEVCILGWGRRIVWETIEGCVPLVKRYPEKQQKYLINSGYFRVSFHQWYTPLNGLLNDSMDQTEYVDLSNSIIANSICLGSTQIGQELVQIEQIKISGYLKVQTHPKGYRLVLDWYQSST